MLTPADRYTIPTMPGFRITVDSGGASLERLVGGRWVIHAAGESLDWLLRCDELLGVRRADLIPEAL